METQISVLVIVKEHENVARVYDMGHSVVLDLDGLSNGRMAGGDGAGSISMKFDSDEIKIVLYKELTDAISRYMLLSGGG